VRGAPPTQLPPLQASLVVQALPSSQATVLFVLTQPRTVSQVSVVQRLASLQFGGAPPAQTPPLQGSLVVHALPSSQAAVLFVFTQPRMVSQVSVVQRLASLQFGAAPPTQAPPLQVSLVVQALPSSQGTELFVFTQPRTVLQVSVVHGFESLQFGGAPPVQVPLLQTSFVVHAFPSSHAAVLLVLRQPSAVSQVSVVQGFESLQFGAAPPTQAPPLQVSLVVQALPSSQAAVLLVLTQPRTVLQVSVVQGFESLQFGAAPPTQTPALQVSLVVQALPSSHAAVLLVLRQPSAMSQVSVVQGFESLQFGGAPPTQAPPLQVSLVVQAFPSSQAAVLLALRQPRTLSQVSVVQTLESSQLGGAPPTQAPPLQVSLVVHASPSLHGAVLFTFRHPSWLSQVSLVQMFESSQLGGAPPTQEPPLQVSLVVQTLPSSHGLVLLAWTQPRTVSQLSVVQRLESSQFGAAPPTQLPALQVSFVVHALPSSQRLVLLVWTQPRSVSQLSVVQTFESSQLGGAAPTHAPALQVSFVVQALPSSQEAVLLVWTQPRTESQVSVVQTFESSQFGGAPPTQAPALQVSLVVQALPSSQEAVLLVLTQPRTESHVSSVHALPSSQLGGAPPTQTPALHVSFVVQALPSSQAAPLESGPVQTSATSSQDSAQSPSPSGPGHGFPELMHRPPLQASTPSQNSPLSQGVVSGSTVAFVQMPPEQVSPVVHALKSVQL